MDDTSLTLEGGQAKHCQAQLTRLQRALGLKGELDSNAQLLYGQEVPAIEPDKSTNFDRKGDVILVSLDLVVKKKDGMLTDVCWAIRTFNTATLEKVSPEDYVRALQESRTFDGIRRSLKVPKPELPERSLGGIRRSINDALEPLCLDHCGNLEHQNEQSEHTHSDSKICNTKRDHCDNPAHKSDQDNYDHTLHKLCKPRRNIILLLSEREDTLRHLQMLGCDPYKHLHIIDIISVNELYQTLLVRSDYGRRNSMTGSNRTRINHDWDDLSTAEQVWAALEYEEPDLYGRKERSFANLKAAIDIACKDALSLNWLRTLEQVEGGAFPGPWLKLHSRKQAEDFLIEYDAARASPISCNKMKVQVRALIESLRLLSPTAFDALLGQIARTHNYTHLLDNDVPTSSHSSSVAATEPATSVRSVAPTPTVPTLPLGAELDDDTQECCRKYHRDQEAFEKELRDAPVSPEKKKEHDSLFDWKPYTDSKGRSKITPITCDNYPRIFAILDRNPGWVMGEVMAKKLRGAIFNREKAQEWYQRLPVTDPRRGEDGGHRKFIKVLKEGEAILRKKSA